MPKKVSVLSLQHCIGIIMVIAVKQQLYIDNLLVMLCNDYTWFTCILPVMETYLKYWQFEFVFILQEAHM